MYLDDILVMAQSREELEGQVQQITALLELLGFIVNQEKSPKRKIQYLGFLINSRGMKIRLTEEKLTQMMAMCLRVQQKHSLSVQELARLIGKMIATLPAIYQAHCGIRSCNT